MNEGRIEQLGTPDELYNAPTTKFAADFFGFENIFRVTGSEIVGPDGDLPLLFEASNGYLAWRPGAVKIGNGDYSGTVIGVAFAGELREYVLQTALGQIKASTPASDPIYKLGDEIAFGLPGERALQLAE